MLAGTRHGRRYGGWWGRGGAPGRSVGTRSS